MQVYTKLAFGFRVNGVYRTYAVCKDDRECNLKPWAVFYWTEPNGTAYQLSPWYMYRGWAERYIRKHHKEMQRHWTK